MGNLTIDRWTQENADTSTRRENMILKMAEEWALKEAPPTPLICSADWGFRLFFRFDIARGTPTDEEKHKTLAWIIRSCGKKFVRFFRAEYGSVTWWNVDDDIVMMDGEEKVDVRVFLEGAALAGCKIVEEERTVKVRKLVCGSAE